MIQDLCISEKKKKYMLVPLPFPSPRPTDLSFNSACLIDESKYIIIAILSYSYMTGKTHHSTMSGYLPNQNLRPSRHRYFPQLFQNGVLFYRWFLMFSEWTAHLWRCLDTYSRRLQRNKVLLGEKKSCVRNILLLPCIVFRLPFSY